MFSILLSGDPFSNHTNRAHTHYENTPIQIYRKFYHQKKKMKIFR